MTESIDKLISELLLDTQELEALLIRERDVLLGPHTENTAKLAAEKETIIQRVQVKMQRFSKSSKGGDKINPAMTELMDLLARCKTINSENNSLINQRLNIVRQSIAIVRTTVDNNNIELYTNQGVPTQSTLRRTLTNA